jgi:Flp pilus assembly protein TadG
MRAALLGDQLGVTRRTSKPIRGGLRGFLACLRRDVRANTLAIMAIALIPLSALAGSAIDVARVYVVKARLQQACDAGVLAGRKFMTPDDSVTTLDATAAAQAQTFFANNFHEGWMRTDDVEFTPTRTDDGQVAGVATATVPMTIMKMFKAADSTLTVTCEARYDLADTDVVFVLDTTGSMACTPSDPTTCGGTPDTYVRNDGTTGYYDIEKTGSKLSALRDAVVDFDTTIRGNIDANTRFRYGFVTYSSTVNVGKLIPQQHMISGDYDYQSRHKVMRADTSTNKVVSASTQSQCQSVANTRVTNSDGGYSDIGNTSWVYYYGNYYCVAAQVTTTSPYWRYETWPQDVTNYVAGQTVPDPTRTNGSTSKWQGCIEEAKTEAKTDFSITDLPPDLDPDLVPSTDDERWKPMWPDVVWYRGTWGAQDIPFSSGQNPGYANSSMQLSGYAPCGMPAKLPSEMTAQEVYNYVHDNDFRALGGTYHDVGMIWGVRMLSRNGIFAANNAAPAGRKLPHQVIVFMTDGVMAPNYNIYGLYGIELFDRRVTGSTLSNDYANHTERFLTECSVAKNKLGIEVYVVALGTALTPELQQCASQGNYAFTASSKAELSAAFKQIAERVAMLRISE